MFDIGFWEIVIIAMVALLVVGPDKLPGLIKDVARWSRKIRRFVIDTKRDIEREIDLEIEKDLPARITELDELMDIAPDKDLEAIQNDLKHG